MPVSSLKAICEKVAIRQVDSITDIGSLEYSQCSSIIQKIVNPEQLERLEANCPQIRGETAELWKSFIARDIHNWREKNYVPKDPTKWGAVYRKYKRQRAREEELAKAQLAATLRGIKDKKDGNLTQQVRGCDMPKVPRDREMLTPSLIDKLKGNAVRSKSFYRGEKEKPKPSNNPLMRKARREAAMITANRMAIPTHKLERPTVAVKPQRLMLDRNFDASKDRIGWQIHRKEEKPAPLNTSPSRFSLEEREARLRRLTMRSKNKTPGSGTVTVIDDDELSDIDDSADDLFSEPSPAKRADISTPPLPSPSNSVFSNSSSSSTEWGMLVPVEQFSTPRAHRIAPHVPGRNRALSDPKTFASASNSRIGSPDRVVRAGSIPVASAARAKLNDTSSPNHTSNAASTTSLTRPTSTPSTQPPRKIIKRKAAEVNIFMQPKKKIATEKMVKS